MRKLLIGAMVLGAWRCLSTWTPFPECESQAYALLAGMHHKTDRAIDFVNEIQPIFTASCYPCHGPQTQMAQLRLDSKLLALQGGISGRVIIPGNSQNSLLIQRILGVGDKARMPLEGKPLSGQQIAQIRTWIDQGAHWPDQASVANARIADHWAYVKPMRPDLPQVQNPLWVSNPIDNFILSRLEKEGLRPSPEASREALIRRVSLDLIGLPPTIGEVDAFVADPAPNAYEKLVERLLASPHYGERWARPWLDVARYGDTDGYDGDPARTIWKYRDWLINALNHDLSFDQFTIEQIAGDMLPNATPEQKIATGFHRNTLYHGEGGVDPQESHFVTILDRVGTTASVWLGSTLACAQCHNHKYDPFTQKEFYQFFAFFESAAYRVEGDDSYQFFIEPVLELPTPQQEDQRSRLREEIARLEKNLKTQTPELDQAQAHWERESASAVWHVLDPMEFSSNATATFTELGDHSVLVIPNSSKDTYTIVARTDLKGIRAFQLEVLPDKYLPAFGPGLSKDGNFILTSFRVQIEDQSGVKGTHGVSLQNPQVDFSQEGFPIASALDDSAETGWGILPHVGEPHTAVFETAAPAGDGNGTTLIFTLEHQSQNHKAAIGRFRISASSAQNPRPAEPLPERIRLILNTRADRRTSEHRDDLSCYYRSITPLLKPVRARLFELDAKLSKIPIATTLVMQERPSWEKPSTHLRVKGNFLNKDEKVYAGVPAVLQPLPESQQANRLGLSRWLVDENNPLVARVTVNRFWEQIFGRGIVETTEDFGTRGARPTHPELLDWLAKEFMQRGWSMKAMHRLMVTSATYRQSSKVTPVLLERDPDNTLLARGPRFRMEAEMIRDVTLAAGGLLSRKIGGPSVFPFQLEGIWKPNPDFQWVTSEGEDGHRRGLYTFWKRTSPYPSFINFDATSREFCTVRRVRTNTPLQALTTLNDQAFFEAAKGLAERLVAEGGTSDETRVAYAFRLCVSRQPNEGEVNELTSLYRKLLDEFNQNPKAVDDLFKGTNVPPKGVSASEFAAWTLVSNTLLNLDQTLTKE